MNVKFIKHKEYKVVKFLLLGGRGVSFVLCMLFLCRHHEEQLSSLVFPLKREDKAEFQQCVSEMLPLRSSGAAGRCLELHNREEVAPF